MAETPEWLAQSEHGPFLQCILAVAWADSNLEQSELDMIREVVEELELTPSDDELQAWLHTKPDGQAAAAEIDDYFVQLFLLRQALLMAAEDGQYADSEKELIEGWARQWDFDMEELLELMEEVQESILEAE